MIKSAVLWLFTKNEMCLMKTGHDVQVVLIIDSLRKPANSDNTCQMNSNICESSLIRLVSTERRDVQAEHYFMR